MIGLVFGPHADGRPDPHSIESIMPPESHPLAPEAPHRRYAQAVLFAIRKHACQERADGAPYIGHPLRVAESLRTIGGISDMDVIIAGLLHDLIEDTDCEWASIAGRFGQRTADLVATLSGDMRLPKPERRSEIVERIRGASAEAKAIRLADRFDNLTDMSGFSEARAAEYLAGSKKILEVCRGANPGLEAALADAISRRS